MNQEKRKEKKTERETKLKELCKVWGPVEADVIKSFLESYGIRCLLQCQMTQSVMPLSTDGMGEIKIVVTEKDIDMAEELLRNLKKESNEEKIDQ